MGLKTVLSKIRVVTFWMSIVEFHINLAEGPLVTQPIKVSRSMIADIKLQKI